MAAAVAAAMAAGEHSLSRLFRASKIAGSSLMGASLLGLETCSGHVTHASLA